MATIRVKRSTASTAPTGLTFGEPAFVDGINSFYVTKNSGTSVRVGAEVDTSISLGTSDNKIPTQNAVKTYVDANVAGGAVSSLNGLTGAVFIGAGTAIGLAVAAKGITVTNTGVQSLTVTSGSGIQAVSGGTTGAVSLSISNTGVTGLVAGTAISVSSGTGNITVTNTGVQSISGTSNQITASGSTGAVTLSLPSSLTVPGSLSVTTDLTVTGNLTVNGTTTTVNSDTMTVDDPMIVLGTSGGVAISASDGGKDRGIAFSYYTGVAGNTGFFGWDASASQFIFASTASIASDVATVSTFAPVQASSVKLYSSVNGVNGLLQPTTLLSDRTYTLPDVSGTIITTGDSGTVTSTMIADGTIVNGDINASAAIVDTKLATISTANKVSLTAIDIDGGTDIGAALTSTDLIIVDDGANGTNRKAAVSRITDYTFGLVSGDITITSGGVATIAANSVALGTDTTGNYLATLSTTAGAGLTISGSGSESAAVTIDLSKITTGIDFGNFAFTTGEFTNSSGTVAIGTVDGGTF